MMGRRWLLNGWAYVDKCQLRSGLSTGLSTMYENKIVRKPYDYGDRQDGHVISKTTKKAEKLRIFPRRFY